MLLLAKKPFPHGDVEWWVYLLDSSRLSGAISRTLVFFAPEIGERRILTWHPDALSLDDVPEDDLHDAFASASPF
jgi:hypothetical protein